MRALLLSFLITLLQPPVYARANTLEAVMQAVRADEWARARTLADRADPVVGDIIEWRWLRAGLGTFEHYRTFLARNPDWPGLDRVRARAEAAMTVDDSPRAIIAFFATHPPQSGAGALALTRAHLALGQKEKARAEAQQAWRELTLAADEHNWFIQTFATDLEALHTARLDALLWQGADDSADLMLGLVPSDWQALAKARMALRGNTAGVDALIRAVPGKLAQHPGLAYERFRWRARKGLEESAVELIDRQSASSTRLGQPARWAGRRRGLARTLMRQGDYMRAYRLAARHHLRAGSAYADLEWLAGYIALIHLRDPKTALTHFDRFKAAVATPISLGRAGFWRARAYERLGDTGAAEAAYREAAEHQTSFYGQLSAQKLELPMASGLLSQPAPWDAGPFRGSSVLHAARLFLAADERDLAEWFLTRLARDTTPQGRAALVGLTLSWNEPHIALRLAKEAARFGEVLPAGYYPLTDLAKQTHPVPTELVLSIARRESEFDPAVISNAGAAGLMQLMPGTAREMAQTLDLPYSAPRLLEDPAYNARLGGAYLAELHENFGSNIILIAAAYNAGPGRVRQWIKDYGDPRSPGTDPIAWIENIPFNETRNYVMRVAESQAIYRARLAGHPVAFELDQALRAR